jgi:16S rRNA processing protein RimM
MENLVNIGYVAKVHGYKGEIRITLNDGISVKKIKGLMFIEFAQKPVPFFIAQFSLPNDNSILIKLEDINNEQDAKELTGRQIWIEPTNVKIKKNEGVGDYIIGFDIIDEHKIIIGQVESLQNYNQLLIQTTIQEKEILLPANEETIIEINPRKKYIQLYIPEGLLNFYLNE